MQDKRKANRRRSSFLSRRGRLVGQPLDRRLRIEPLEDRRMLAVITVDSFLDNFDPGAPTTDGLITLREAILAANTDAVVGDAPAGSGADTIEFDGALIGSTITLGGTELVINDDVTLTGLGADALTIDAGNGTDNTSGTGDGFRIFNIDDGDVGNQINVAISGLTLSGGDVSDNGGAIINWENLSVTSSTLSGNSATSKGGGIFNNGGTATLASSTFSGNSAYSGGGIYNTLGGTATLTSSILSGNSANANGGGIFNNFSMATVTNSTLSDNTAGNVGGGINNNGGTATVTSSILSGNTASDGGGIFINSGTATLTSSTLSGNSATSKGGGIFNNGGTATLASSTFSGNSAYSGGGIYNTLGGTATLTSSILSGNSANANGGGIFNNFSMATVTNSTLSDNTAGNVGGGINNNGGTATLTSTLVAENMAGSDPDVLGTVSGAYNLIGDGTGMGGLVDGINGNQVGSGVSPIDPMLGPLQDNGGPTLTHALLPGSPAIDAGDPTILFDANEFDQRGAPFVRVTDGGVNGLRIDIGAYERQTVAGLNLTVDTNVDENDGDYSAGDLSLREAVGLANGSIGANTIMFDATAFAAPQTILLGLGEIEITEALTIDATSLAADVTIDAGALSRIFNITAATGNFTLAGLTLTGGRTTGDNIDSVDTTFSGGGVRSLSTGSLTLDESTVSGNSTAGRYANGGGIFARGGVTLTDSTVSGNSTAGYSASGGGFYARLAVTLTNSIVSENSTADTFASGGGIFSFGFFVNLTNSTVSGNSTTGDSADGGGIRSFGTVRPTSSTISGNSTAGYASEGGGIFARTGVTLTNSTVSGNSTAGNFAEGGGIRSGGPVTLNHSTVTDNHANHATAVGGGIWDDNDPIVITNSIVAGNTAGGGMEDIDPGTGTLNIDFSLIEQTGLTITGSDNIIGMPADLGPLASNGGPTRTHALMSTSLAIDAGDPGFATPPDFDQRGAPFVRASGTIDMGAYERQTVAGLNLVVDTAVDENDGDYTAGDLSLREAAGLANGSVGTDTITFDATVFATPQTILLSLGELDFSEAATIGSAPLSSNVTIDAQQNSRIFNITATTGDFTLAGLTLTGGITTDNNANASDTTYSGGAVRTVTSGSLTIDQSTIRDNSTTGTDANGGGIFSTGDVVLTSSTVSGNSTEGQTAKAGGLFSKGAVTLTNSTISGNSTAGLLAFAGGLYSFGALDLTNSTVSGNSTTGSFGYAGGILTSGAITLASSTVTDNHANDPTAMVGGIWNTNDPITFTNSIVAGNTAGGGIPDIDPGTGTFSVNYSLIGTGVTPDAGTSGNNQVTNNPLIGPLADNGGPTETHALLAGSLAIDAGDPAIVSLLPSPYDQRGAPFVRVFDDPVALGSGIDIGAFELQPITDSADFDGDNDVDGADFLAWQRGFGTSNPTTADGDADNDDDVDGDDLGIWEGQFGQTAPVEFGVEADGLFFTDDLVTGVLVIVDPEWLETDQVWLAINISGINDGPHHHGFQVGLVSDTTFLVEDQGEALVSVDWTTDTNLTHSPETYSVHIQPIVGGQPFGASDFGTFGPFLQAGRQSPVLSQRAELVDAAMAWEMASDVSAEEPALVLAAASVEQTTAVTDELHQGVSVARMSADTTLSGNSTEEQQQEAPWLSDELLEGVFG